LAKPGQIDSDFPKLRQAQVAKNFQQLGRSAWRECEVVFFRHCERSEAIHLAVKKKEWIASSGLSFFW
jgi:hypothetical protein